MFLTAEIGGLHTGDMIAQLFFFLLVIAMITAITGMIVYFFVFKKRKKQLARIEEKLDKLLDKEREKQ